MFGEVTNPKLNGIQDLSLREGLIFAPLIFGTLALGVFPWLVFDVTTHGVDTLVAAYQHAIGH